MIDLPSKPLWRVDEVATYFDVTERTIRLWIEHGHLEADKIVGTIRITRESVKKCMIRFVPKIEK
jgi:excisionase family DNA binding protein